MTIHSEDMIYSVRIHSEDGGLWAEVEQLPGCFASGDDLDDLRTNLEEAIGLYLSDGTDHVVVKLKDAESVEKLETQRYLVCT